MTAASAVIIVLVIASALILNSGMVDFFARKQFLLLFNREYRGRLELKEVRLRFPDEVTIISPVVFEEGATKPAAKADSISLKFNFLSLLRPKITMLSFREVDVEGFRAAVVEYPDGQLNIQKIFTRRHPEEPEVLAIGKFRSSRFKLRNGSLSWKPAKARAYELKNLHLDMSRVFVAKYEFMGTIRKMQFTMPDKGLTIRKGSGTFAFSSVRSDVIGLDIETGKSHARLSVSMDGFDIFSGISKERIQKNRTFIHLESISLDTSELKSLIPIPAIPPGVYRISGDAKGTLSDLEIMQTSIEHGENRLGFSGEMLNLLDPKSLSFRLKIDKSVLSPEFLSLLIRDERYLKLARDARGVTFSGMLRGQLDKWMTNIEAKTAIGNGSADFETTQVADGRYHASGNFALEKTEPHRLLGIAQLRSGFSGSGSFNGTVGTVGIEAAHIEASIKNAFWQQQQISSGSITLDLDGEKIDLSTDLRGPDGSNMIMAGLIDYSGISPSYEAGGSVRKLDLSKATGRPDLKSDLNGTFELKGQGIDLAALNMKASMVLAPSSINDFRFSDRSTVSASVVQSSGSSSVSMMSEAFDLSLQGNESIARMIEAFQTVSSCLAKEIGQTPDVKAPYGTSSCSFNYRVAIRDLTPLRPFLPIKDIQFKGTSSGKLSCAEGRLTMDADLSLYSLSSGASFLLSNAMMNASAHCTANGLSTARISGTAGSLKLFGRELKNLNMLSSFNNDRLFTSLELSMPQLNEKLTADFSTRRAGNLTTISIETLQLTTPKGLWLTSPGGTIDMAHNFIRINHVRFGKGAQSIELDGLLSNSIPGSFQGNLSNIDLAEAKFFLIDAGLKPLNGMVNGRFTVSGNPGTKTSTLDLRGSNVIYNELSIGTVHLAAIHAGSHLRFDYESRGFTNPATTATGVPVNTIRGSGSIPLVLNYSPIEVRIPENRPLQLSFHSDDLSARLIPWIVPIFDYADGAIPTDLRITGHMPEPDIFLTTRLDDTIFRIGPTQVTYTVQGSIVGSPSRIDLGSITVRDNQQGTGTISGMIGIRGLEPVSVNLAGRFSNLLLYNKKDMKDDTSFGTIRGSTDDLRFSSELTEPKAEGELRLTSTDFSLYRKGSNESAKYIGVEKFIRFVPRRPVSKPVETAKVPSHGPAQFHYNLLDILQIRNLRLLSNVPIRSTMIFDRIRGERIEATMNNLTILVNKSGQQYSLFGSVDITGGKYTFSNSSFDLENSGKVSWNNEDIRQGRLSDIFGSKQLSAIDAQTGERDNVRLLNAVSGTIEKPDVRMGYYLNDDPQPWSAVNMIGRQASHIDPNADLNVISMLFSRQWYFHPERQTSRGVNPVSSVGFSAGTGLLSSQLSGIVQNIAGLESFNVNLGTGANGNLSGLELYFSVLVPGTSGKIRFVGTGTPVSGSGTATNDYYSSSQKIEYRVSPKVYVEAFRSYGMTGNDAAYINLQKPTENWGVSVSYREKFHTWGQFWNRLFGGKKKEKEKENDKKE